MSSATSPGPTHLRASDLEAERRRHASTQAPARRSEFGGYRYTNIKDAVAEAARHPRGSE